MGILQGRLFACHTSRAATVRDWVLEQLKFEPDASFYARAVVLPHKDPHDIQ